MKDLRRISWLAILFLVVLRIAIGWQLLYEGMWKYSTLSGPNPWTAEGYLKNAQGPFRDHFREMTGDPDDLNWLDYEKMSAKWYDWRNRFQDHYELNSAQLAILNVLVDGDAHADTAAAEQPPFPPVVAPLAKLPESVNLDKYTDVVVFEKGLLKALAPVTPREESEINGMVDVVEVEVVVDGKKTRKYHTSLSTEENVVEADASEAAFYKAFNTIVRYSRQLVGGQLNELSRASRKEDSGIDSKNFAAAASKVSSTLREGLPYRHQLAASLLGNPENTGVIYERVDGKGPVNYLMGTIRRPEQNESRNSIVYGKIHEYKELLKEYETALTQASIDYQYEHATMLGRKLAILRSDLVGPIRAMEAELKENALKLLTPEQRTKGGLPPADTPLFRADMMAMWGLLILGPLLIIGLFTRLSAFLAALMVFSFYLVLPPWPGVPPAPGPEHSLIVNKNLIEVLALLAIAAIPSGKWFGVDAFVSKLLFGKSSKSD